MTPIVLVLKSSRELVSVMKGWKPLNNRNLMILYQEISQPARMGQVHLFVLIIKIIKCNLINH